MNVTSPRVLLADDDKEVADAYALRLKGMADVKIAYSGKEALEITNPADPPDVVLLDRHMPNLSGDEVLAELHGMEIHTREIMVTAIDPGHSTNICANRLSVRTFGPPSRISVRYSRMNCLVSIFSLNRNGR